MTTVRTIVHGPSKWDLMLALFERQHVVFRLDDHSAITVKVEALYDRTYADSIVTDTDELRPVQVGWLMFGFVKSSADHDEIYMEYSTQTRNGHAVVVPEGVWNQRDSNLESAWAQLMGLPYPL